MIITMLSDGADYSVEISSEKSHDLDSLIGQFIDFARALGYADTSVAFAMADHDFVRSYTEEDEEST